MGEGFAAHQAKGLLEVGNATCAPGLASGPEATEEVQVDEDVFGLVGQVVKVSGRESLAGVREVVRASSWVDTEPVA